MYDTVDAVLQAIKRMQEEPTEAELMIVSPLYPIAIAPYICLDVTMLLV